MICYRKGYKYQLAGDGYAVHLPELFIEEPIAVAKILTIVKKPGSI